MLMCQSQSRAGVRRDGGAAGVEKKKGTTKPKLRREREGGVMVVS